MNMKILFRGKELDLHYSMRIYIIYENIMGKGLGFDELQSYTAVISLFYAAVVASLQYNKMDSNVTYDEFINWLDEDSAPRIQEFTNWFVGCVNAQADKVDEVVNKDTANKAKKQDPKK